MVMLPGNRLLIRARNPEEAMRFSNAFMHMALSDYQVNAEAWSSGTVIKGGTVHTIGLNYDPQCVRRIAAKIGYGLYGAISGERLDQAIDDEIRKYILGLSQSEDEPVKEGPELSTFTTNEDPHVIVISSEPDGMKAFVRLYGLHLLVDLGPSRLDFKAFGVNCAIDGSGMKRVSDQELVTALHEVSRIAFSHRWKEFPRNPEAPSL